MIRIVDIPPSEQEAKPVAKPVKVAKADAAAVSAGQPSAGQPSAAQYDAILNEAAAKWSKLSKRVLSQIGGREELVSLLIGKYKMKKPAAEREVDELLNGRAF